MDCTNIIGEKIKSLRTLKEISIEELAERTELTVEQIRRIEENVDIPSLAPLVKIARDDLLFSAKVIRVLYMKVQIDPIGKGRVFRSFLHFQTHTSAQYPEGLSADILLGLWSKLRQLLKLALR